VSATFHTPGHLMIWPYGWTSDDSRPEMTRADHRVFVALGKAAAKRNDYLPLQWGTGRRTSGSAIDWQYGDQRIFSFLIEMGDKLVNPEEVIGREVRRNYDALLYLMEQADCPYRVIGKAQQFCGPFFDDFEAARGWVRDPDGSDDATEGTWGRGVPKADANQPARAPSGQSILGTGLKAGHDVDGGTTTIRSTLVSLPARVSTLHFRYRATLSSNAAPADGLRVQLVSPNGQVHLLVSIAHGTGSSRSIDWTSVDLPVPAGLRNQRAAIQFTATDRGADSTVEAGVDDVRITAP
jgi:carboxypeptidase T